MKCFVVGDDEECISFGEVVELADMLGWRDSYPSSPRAGWNARQADAMEEECRAYCNELGFVFTDEHDCWDTPSSGDGQPSRQPPKTIHGATLPGSRKPHSNHYE